MYCRRYRLAKSVTYTLQHMYCRRYRLAGQHVLSELQIWHRRLNHHCNDRRLARPSGDGDQAEPLEFS